MKKFLRTGDFWHGCLGGNLVSPVSTGTRNPREEAEEHASHW